MTFTRQMSGRKRDRERRRESKREKAGKVQAVLTVRLTESCISYYTVEITNIAESTYEIMPNPHNFKTCSNKQNILLLSGEKSYKINSTARKICKNLP